MKKIIYIELCNFKDYPLGGHLSFALHLTTAMRGDIDVAGCRTDNLYPIGKWVDCEINGFQYHFFNMLNMKKSFKKPIIPSRITAFLTLKKYIKQILAQKDYDIIMVQTPEVLFSLPKKFLSKVCLISPGVSNPLSFSRYKWARKLAGIYDRIYFNYVKRVNLILPAADNKAIGEYVLRSKGSLNSGKIVQFPTRYDADIFNVQPQAQVRKELDIPQNDLILVTTGRLNWFKGWKYMIDSFIIYHEKHPNSKLYFIGKGEDEQKIRDYTHKVNIDASVFLAGAHPLPIVAKYLNAADIFIMGSYFEGWSTALVEAIACAKPCVVTEFSSAHDLIKDGENGYVQCERDEKGFAILFEKALSLSRSTLAQYASNVRFMSVQTMREQLNKILHFE